MFCLALLRRCGIFFFFFFFAFHFSWKKFVPPHFSAPSYATAPSLWLSLPIKRNAQFVFIQPCSNDICDTDLFSLNDCARFKGEFVVNTWQFNSAKTIFAFSNTPQMRRRAKLFMSCCRPYLVHQYTILPFPNLHLPGEIFTCKGVKS